MDHRPSFDLTGKSAVVTGAAGLLAEQIVSALASAGAGVLLADKDGPKAGERAASLTRQGYKTFACEVDVTMESSVSTMVGTALDRFGGLDILVNAAGRNFYTSVETLSLEDWDETWHSHVTGTFLCCRAVGAHLVKQRSGSIINIGSIYGIVAADHRIYGTSGWNSTAAYAASKGAVIQLTRYLAAYWGHTGVRVNCISPGGFFNHQPRNFVDRYTDKTPLGRMGNENDMRGAVVFLASDASTYMTGHNLVVDGGWTAW